MTDAVYRIVEHDGGWAYKLGDVFSETFPNRQTAEAAAERVVEEQRSPGEDEAISWEDERGIWHEEAARGADRPNAYVNKGTAETDPPLTESESATRRAGSSRHAADLVLRAYDKGDQYARHGAHLSRQQVRSEPVIAMLFAMACGFILGVLTRQNV